jgi:ribosomal protein S18 acetylase RimI-like enzyme
MDIAIRPFGLDEMEAIGSIDRSIEQNAEYIVEPLADPPGLGLKRHPLLAPVPMASWAPNELAGRLELWRRSHKEGATFLGAFDNARMVGFAILSQKLFDDTVEIYGLSVTAKYRRRGVATRLLAAVEEAARGLGAVVMTLFTTRQNAAGLDFYLGASFRVIGLQDTTRVKNKGWEIRLAKTVK